MTDESNKPPDNPEQPGPQPGGEGEPSSPSPDAPPAAETPEQKKARLIAEHKAKLAAKAAGQGAEPAKAPSGSSASSDPAGAQPSADDEKAARIAEAKARAAAAKEAAGAGAPKPPVKKKDEGPKPEDASNHPLVGRLRGRVGDAAVLEATTFLGQLSIQIDPARVVEVCRALREDAETPFDYLSDLTCVHWPERWEAPFEVVYNLYSISGSERVRVKAAAGEAEGVESVTGVWPAANWMEREVYDLYGVRFGNHPDLRRLLLPSDWQGHPLRKDYPLEFIENEWTERHLPEFDEVQREQLEQRRAYGLEELSSVDERRVRELFRAGKELLPKEHR